MCVIIKSIVLIFENCEYVAIEAKDIRDIEMKNITNSIRRIAANAIERMDTAEHVFLQLKPDANKEYCPFNLDEYKSKVFDRITEHSDITSIITTDDIGREKEYYVPYDGNEVNKLQKTKLINGELLIVISKSKDINDYI